MNLIVGELSNIEAQMDSTGFIRGAITVMYDPVDGFITDATEWAILSFAAIHDVRIYRRDTVCGHAEYYFCAEGWRIHPLNLHNTFNL